MARRLSAAGHDVKVANSRGPETIQPDVLANGARAVTTAQALEDVDVVILSIPLNRLSAVVPLISKLPVETVVVDTSNYYPHRDGKIDAIESGQVESAWVVELLGRPIVKPWNAIGSDSFAIKAKPSGSPDPIAIPVAADREQDRKVGMQLVEDTGFDAFDAGPIADSWRQQPGAPAYCTDLTAAEMDAALAGRRALSPAEASRPGARGHYGARRGRREEPGRGLRRAPESRVVHVIFCTTRLGRRSHMRKHLPPDLRLDLVVAPLARPALDQPSVTVKQVLRRPSVIVQGPPDRELVVDRDRIGQAVVTNPTVDVLGLLAELELRRVHSDNHQAERGVVAIPRLDERQGPDPVDAGGTPRSRPAPPCHAAP